MQRHLRAALLTGRLGHRLVLVPPDFGQRLVLVLHLVRPAGHGLVDSVAHVHAPRAGRCPSPPVPSEVDCLH